MTTDQFLACLQKIADGLEVVHAEGVVHGDITPKNIICDDRGNATIVDFGFATSPITAFENTQSSHPQPLGGTLGWAAPEQISVAFGDIDPRTDVWAVGALAYWFLTGNAPFAKHAWQSILATEPIDCNCLEAQSTSELRLKTIADRALRPLADRPSTIGQLLLPE